MKNEPLVYEIIHPVAAASICLRPMCPETDLPKDLLRSNLGLPELSQLDVVRHYLHLSQLITASTAASIPLGLMHDEVQPQDQRRCRASAGFCGDASAAGSDDRCSQFSPSCSICRNGSKRSAGLPVWACSLRRGARRVYGHFDHAASIT